MPKNNSYRARRADRPTVAALHQRQDNLAAMRSVASASANQHADEMETALITVTELAAESGVAVWGDYDQRDLVAIVADLDPDAPAAKRVAEALGDVLTHKHAVEALTGDRVLI